MTTATATRRLFTVALLATAFRAAPPAGAAGPSAAQADAPRPIRALLVTGGCCHDYNGQKSLIPAGVSARARVEWTVVHEGGTSQTHKVSIYENPGWADNYDVVVHNECFGAVSDRAFIGRIVAPHRDGVGAVFIHCSMHSYRALPSDEYRECLGVTSRRHGPQHPLDVKTLVATHPVMIGFPAVWKTGNEELYAIEKVWPGATPLAQAHALDSKKDEPVIWVNTFGKGRVFGTTLAHHTKTMDDPAYLDLLTRGLLWSCGRLTAEGKPAAGYEAAGGK